MIWIRPDLAPLFAGLGFDEFLRLGERTVKRSPDGARHTAAFARGGRGFYVKAHTGVGWAEILKNWLQGKRAIVDATTEVRALERCSALGIPVPVLAAWGVAGRDPGARRSFVVTEELPEAERVSTLLAPPRPLAPSLRHALARRLGTLVARLHAAPLAHQDLYLEHVFLRRLADGDFELFLLDLHRTVPAAPAASRWRVKDLGALAGSAARAGATRADGMRFLRAYAGGTGRLPTPERELWRAVARRLARPR